MFQGMDLAAVASAAGLGGSAVAAIGAALFFKGLLMRIITQVIITAALTFVGFIALLNFLGFEIVQKPEGAPVVAAASGDDIVRPQFDTGAAPPPATTTAANAGKKVYYVKSPFAKKG